MLERTLGAGHVRARGGGAHEFDRVNETQERYDPDGQVIRSTQSVNSNSKIDRANPRVSVQNNLPNADSGSQSNGTQEGRQEETTNYEIGKTVRTLIREQPRMERISLAVMVDGVDAAADGKRYWQRAPRTNWIASPPGQNRHRLRRKARRPRRGRQHARSSTRTVPPPRRRLLVREGRKERLHAAGADGAVRGRRPAGVAARVAADDARMTRSPRAPPPSDAAGGGSRCEWPPAGRPADGGGAGWRRRLGRAWRPSQPDSRKRTVIRKIEGQIARIRPPSCRTS